MFFQLCPFIVANFNKKIQDRCQYIESMFSCEEIVPSFDQIGHKLPQLLLKESNNCIINSIYVSLSNELLVQKYIQKKIKNQIDLDNLSQNVSISSLHNDQKSGNICIFCKYYYFSLRKYWTTFGGRSSLKLAYFPINNQNTLKILKMFAVKVHLKKCIYENYISTVRIFK